MYPRLVVDLTRLRHNANALCRMCAQHGISLALVTKVFCADETMVKTVLDAPLAYLADSRLENMARYPETGIERIMLRLPLPEEAPQTVAHSDISFVSELAAIEALEQAAEANRKKHGVVLMIDMGDLREGLYHTNRESILHTAKTIASKPWLEMAGVGVNLTCFGSVIPTKDTMQRFAVWAEELQTRLGSKFRIVSGGNSSSLDLMLEGDMPKAVNHLRLGESLLRAEETAYGKRLAALQPDVVTLETALLEIQEKPSYPDGEIGLNAFGEKMQYEDRGLRRRGILKLGRQDTEPRGLTCFDAGVEVVGASSDHLIVDLTNAEKTYQVGDTLRFSLSYSAILRGFSSAYVDRVYLG